MLSFDWYSSGYHPWRIPVFMVIIGIAGTFALSMLKVEFESVQLKSKYPATVFLLNNNDVSRMSYDARLLPFTRWGPVWADPVSSGMEGELFFPLSAGLTKKSQPKTLDKVTSVDIRPAFINYLSLPPVQVERWLLPSRQGSELYTPVFEAWSADLEGFYSEFELTEKLNNQKNRKGTSTCWVHISEWGTPLSVLITDSSGNSDIDRLAVESVKKLRWLPRASGRQGLISVDWEQEAAK